MHIALVVPGGVDRSGEYRVIPALLALIKRLSIDNEVKVFALGQEPHTGEWDLVGARIYNIGSGHTVLRTICRISEVHRAKPFDLVQAFWSGACGLIAVAAGTLLGIASFIHVAGGELVSMADIGYGGVQRWRGHVREALTLRSAAAVTAASAPTIQTLVRYGVTARRVPLGIDLTAWPPRIPVPRVMSRRRKLIHVASLNRVKDQATLLRALALLDRRGLDFEMDIVGEDTLHGEVQSMALQLQLSDKVRFHGFLPQRCLRPLMEAADLMIISSRHETGPVVLLEAAAVGVPTVGTEVGHIAEWAPQAAVATPVANPDLLAAAILRVLNDDPLRLSIAVAAQRRAVREDVKYTADGFRAIYRQTIRSGRGIINSS